MKNKNYVSNIYFSRRIRINTRAAYILTAPEKKKKKTGRVRY